MVGLRDGMLRLPNLNPLHILSLIEVWPLQRIFPPESPVHLCARCALGVTWQTAARRSLTDGRSSWRTDGQTATDKPGVPADRFRRTLQRYGGRAAPADGLSLASSSSCQFVARQEGPDTCSNKQGTLWFDGRRDPRLLFVA